MTCHICQLNKNPPSKNKKDKALCLFPVFSHHLWIIWPTAAVVAGLIICFQQTKLFGGFSIKQTTSKQTSRPKMKELRKRTSPVHKRLAASHRAADRRTKAAVDSMLCYIGHHSCNRQLCCVKNLQVHTFTDSGDTLSQAGSSFIQIWTFHTSQFQSLCPPVCPVITLPPISAVILEVVFRLMWSHV